MTGEKTSNDKKTDSTGEKEETENDGKKKRTNAEIENVLYAFVPKTAQDNMAPLKYSSLKDLFNNKSLLYFCTEQDKRFLYRTGNG